MATIKSYTDIEQSKKLADILPIETADMFWQSNLNSSDRQYLLDMGEEEHFNIEINFEHCGIGEYDIPAWSLAALLKILNFPSLTQNKEDEWEVCVFDHDNDDYIKKTANNPIDACVAMIEKLHELKML